jgi:hypothetical protein
MQREQKKSIGHIETWHTLDIAALCVTDHKTYKSNGGVFSIMLISSWIVSPDEASTSTRDVELNHSLGADREGKLIKFADNAEDESMAGFAHWAFDSQRKACPLFLVVFTKTSPK